jgi:outer membrane protein OmpA-like peptidoglycan-associated protein
MIKKVALLSLPILLFTAMFPAHFAFAQVPQFQYDTPNDPQNLTALFMLSLYNKKLAGGDTGVCVDFSPKDGKVNIGLNDSVFKLGQSTLSDPAAYQKKVQALLAALAVTQSDGSDSANANVLNVDITGHADGVPVGRQSGTNEDLAAKRADSIANLFSNDPKVHVTAKEGLGSPELERIYATNRSAADCPTRRKVVISVPIKGNQVQLTANGKFQFTPDSFNTSLGTRANALVDSAISQVTDGADGSGNTAYAAQVKLWANQKNLSGDAVSKLEANYIYQQLQSGDHPKISKKCDQFPLKQLTLSMLAAKLGGLSFSYDQGVAIGQIQKTNTGYVIADLDTKQTVKLAPIAEGTTPPILYSCFTTDSAPNWDASLKTFDKASGGNTFVSGTSLLAVAQKGGNRVTSQSKFDVGFDPSLMKPEDVTNDPRVPDSVKSRFAKDGKPMRGFFCKQCGHGFFFEEVKDASGKVTGYNPVYDDRMVQPNRAAGGVDPLTKALNNLTADNPSVLGTSLKPMIYVVDACPTCNCNPMDKIRSKSAAVTTIDPLAMGSAGPRANYESSGVQDLNSKCVVRPPVWHNCGAAPNTVPPHQSNQFAGLLSYKSPVDNQVYGADDFKGLVNQISNCPGSVVGPEQKVNSVSCSGSAASRLPSSDVGADCPLTAKAQ